MPHNPRSSPTAGRASQAQPGQQHVDAAISPSQRGTVTAAMAALLGRRSAAQRATTSSAAAPAAARTTTAPPAASASRVRRSSGAEMTPRDPDQQRYHAQAVLNALARPDDGEINAIANYYDVSELPDDLTDEDIDEAVVDEFGDVVLEDVELEDELEYDGQGDEGQELHLAGSFDPAAVGLKEINNLAHFSVSSHKPGNGVAELLSEDLDKYWQSDGQQPHHLTIHFLRRVEIRAIRFYVDYNQDESYTPTLINFSAGTGHHDLIEFATMPLSNPVGWQEVDLSQIGGGADGKSLCCWIVQMQVKENHQNGKDTHIRAIKMYALDENAKMGDGIGGIEDGGHVRPGDISAELGEGAEEAQLYRLLEMGNDSDRAGSAGLGVPDFMKDFEIR